MENPVQLSPLLVRNIFTAGGILFVFIILCGFIRFFTGVYRRKKKNSLSEKRHAEIKKISEKP